MPEGDTYSLSWIDGHPDQVRACTQTTSNNIWHAWTVEVLRMRLRHAGWYKSQCSYSTNILLSITFNQQLSLLVGLHDITSSESQMT